MRDVTQGALARLATPSFGMERRRRSKEDAQTQIPVVLQESSTKDRSGAWGMSS